MKIERRSRGKPKEFSQVRLENCGDFLPVEKIRATESWFLVYVDRHGKLKQDFRSELNDQDLVGQVEFKSNWPAGYGAMTIIKYPANR